MKRIKRAFSKLYSLLFYAGLDAEGFAYAQEDFDKENRKMLTAISGCLTGIMAILLFLSFFVASIERNKMVYGLSIVIGSVILFGCKVVCKYKPHAITYFTQILCVALYSFGIVLGTVSQPDEIAVTFVILVVVLPLIFYDRPINSLTLQILAAFVYLCLARQNKVIDPSDPLYAIYDSNSLYLFSSDFIDVVGYGILGIALNLFLTNIKATTAKARVEAERANQSKTTFLFNMSHDIRTPMNAIIGFTNIAKKNIGDDEKVIESLDKVTTSSDYLLSLINDVLDMSRAESGTIEVNTEERDIYKCLDNTIEILKDSAESKDLSIKVEYGEITNNYVYMDAFHMKRVLVNIISNAIKYTPEGGKITVGVTQTTDANDEGIANYRFEVTDTGIGISKEFQGMIFDAFSRERTSTVSGLQGTGLGMAITKKLVDIMGGKISVKSEIGEGSTFIVDMPLSVQINHVDKEQDVYAYTSPADLSGKRVLVVDDNDLNREIAVDMLNDVGVICEEADDGKSAVDILAEKGPTYYDIVLMDIQMPIMDGYEATRNIRAMYPDDRIPIVAMTANAFAEDKANAKNAGMDGHIAKPVDMDKLIEALNKLA